MQRPRDRHLDAEELKALAPSQEEGQELLPESVRVAERHAASCPECASKLSQYRELIGRTSNVIVSAASPGAECPQGKDVDWHEVVAGLWPEYKAQQLIMHAAICDHCGPLLRAATSADDDATPDEEKFLAQLNPPSRPDHSPLRASSAAPRWRLARWLVPALAIIAIVIALSVLRSSSSALSGTRFAELAASTHKQRADRTLTLEVKFQSQQELNTWLKTNVPFAVDLPTSPPPAGEERPYQLQGARLLQVGGRPAALIAYQMQSGPTTLIVTPDSAAEASGGVQVDYKKLSFHYRTLNHYKVVTWSLHGLTYALVSQEGNSTQQSCMVCHSAMRDRDLTHTPTPLPSEQRSTHIVQ